MKIKNARFLPTILIVLLMSLVVSCNKDDDSRGGNDTSRTVKYELSGTYTGTLMIVYVNEDGVNQIVEDVSLPWSKEVTVNTSDPLTIFFSARSEVGGFGQANENMSGKILVGGVVKKSGGVNSTNDGFIDLGLATQI